MYSVDTLQVIFHNIRIMLNKLLTRNMTTTQGGWGFHEGPRDTDTTRGPMSSSWRQLKPGSPVTRPRLAQMSVKEHRLNSGLGRFELLVADVMIKFEPHPLSLKHITPMNMIRSCHLTSSWTAPRLCPSSWARVSTVSLSGRSRPIFSKVINPTFIFGKQKPFGCAKPAVPSGKSLQ